LLNDYEVIALDKKIAGVVQQLESGSGGYSRFKATVGLDGFIDKIMRVVLTRESPESYTTFTSIGDFSKRIALAAGTASDMELITQEVRFGGNAPIMADALVFLDVNTCCVGAMGYPELNRIFRSMHPNCRLISINPSGETMAFEFDDGKLMFAELSALEHIDWKTVKQSPEFESIIESFINSDLIALVNWSLLINVGSVWKGILNELLQRNVDLSKKQFFFDIADPSKRTASDLLSAIEIMNEFACHSEVTLGLNGNEMRWVQNCLCPTDLLKNQSANDRTALEQVCEAIFNQMRIHSLVVHFSDWSVNVIKDGKFSRVGKLVEKPKITTGGGDNFNAGYCFAKMQKFDNESCLIIAMGVSGFYVKNGHSPTILELCDYLQGI
jgi:sugar/nucleoside kinase (ribokinase family)